MRPERENQLQANTHIALTIGYLSLLNYLGLWGSLANADEQATAARNAINVPPPSNVAIGIHVIVAGEVRTPGRYVVTTSSSIAALLAEAGGLAEMGGDTLYIDRINESGQSKRYSIRLDDQGRLLAEQWLHDGDTLTVARAAEFYIVGEVQKPSGYRLDANMTVMQAIAKAGDITASGSYRRVEIKRKDSNGVEVTIKAKLEDLVEPGDVIRVKESFF